MKSAIPENIKAVIFDIDGTLTESKQPMDAEMGGLLVELMRDRAVAVISGAGFEQCQRQILSRLPSGSAQFEKMLMFPANATTLYRFEGGVWNKAYSRDITQEAKDRVFSAIAVAESTLGTGLITEKVFGKRTEDRGTQITYSGLGQEAPLEEKRPWDPDQAKRKAAIEIMTPLLPEFDFHIGGMTSIDITLKGYDKAYGIGQIQEILGLPLSQMLFVGDALFPGGNDYPARTTGVPCAETSGVDETKRIIRDLLAVPVL
jgi:hypothetical protein